MIALLNHGLATLGDWMRRHARIIRIIQWLVVLFYVTVLVIPALLPLPDNQARIFNNLATAAQFIFWGLWWPFVLLSMVLLGRVWCGVLCPEGTLSEWASRHGRGRKVPRWLRWGGWPTVGFLLTTLYGQMISVYDYAQAALLILGGSTVAAMLVGYLYGRGKRVWCRYLCPVSGVFNLLSRLAPVHFKVDESKWLENSGAHLPPPNCAPLLDIRRMKGNADCHACGRCSGQRDAVQLIARSGCEEIVQYGNDGRQQWPVRLLLYGVIGFALGAFQWTLSPWFIDFKQQMAEWLVNHDIFWPLNANAPWWILTHYPSHNDAFSWLDGFSLVLYLSACSLILGSALHLLLRGAAALARGGRALFEQLALCLVPLGGCGLFLGLSATTVKLLRYEGLALLWVPQLRAALLIGACFWGLWLATKVAMQHSGRARFALIASVALCELLVAGVWYLMFWVW